MFQSPGLNSTSWQEHVLHEWLLKWVSEAQGHKSQHMFVRERLGNEVDIIQELL
jgi:hypothetical protein